MSRSGKIGPPASETPETAVAVARQRRLQVGLLAAFALGLLGFDCLGGLMTRPEPAGGAGQGRAQFFATLPDDCAIAPELAPFYGLAMNINRATERDLTLLPGIGPVLAGRITAKRGELGGFADVRDLREVPGIGEKTLAALMPRVCVQAR